MEKASPQVLINLSREYLKSYYSINSYIGCTVNCGYCFLAPIKIVPMRPIKVIEEDILVQMMLDDPLFEKGRTVISINNRTDPFIDPDVKESTFRILEQLERHAITNPVTITTKGLLSRDDVRRIEQLVKIQVIIIVTYNGIPEEIQPISAAIQERTMINVSASDKLTLLHQFRPIIPNVNDDEATIRNIVNFASQFCHATIYQGIRINSFIDERLQQRNYHYHGTYDKHKQKSTTVDSIFTMLQYENPSYAIFEHTSCAISYLYSTWDYNQHFKKRQCIDLCPNYYHCMNDYRPSSVKEAENGLRKIGIATDATFTKDGICIQGCINDEQRSYIRHILQRSVNATERTYSFSEKLME